MKTALLHRVGRTASALTIAASVLVAHARPSAAAPPGAAAAPNAARDEARDRFKRGVQLYNEGDFRGALIEFRRAYEVLPNYRLLYNLGQASAEVQDHAGALRYFDAYLAEGKNEIPAARRKQVQAEIEKLRGRAAQLTVKVNVDGAEVLVDDVLVGTSPLKEALAVSAGRRRITAQKSGLPAVTRSIDLAGGDKSELKLELTEDRPVPPPVAATAAPPPPVEPPPPTAPVPPPPPPAPPASPGMGTPFWISLGATVVFAGGAAVTGVLARGAHDDFEKKLAAKGARRDDIEDARSRTQTFALTTDVLGGAAILGAGLATYFAISRKPADPASPSASLRLSPGGAALTGTF